MSSEFDYFKNMILKESISDLNLGERVYKNAYFARLIEVMGKHFPTLEFILDDLFPHLVRDYLNSHKPSSWAVDNVGLNFANFIYQNTSHYDFGVSSRLIGDIASFEETQNQCAVAKNESLLKSEQFEKLKPDDWNSVRFPFASSSFLLSLHYPVHEIIEAAQKKILSEPPLQEPTFYLFYRQENDMHWLIVPERLAIFLQRQMSESLLSAAKAIENGEEVLIEFTQLLTQKPHIFKSLNCAPEKGVNQ